MRIRHFILTLFSLYEFGMTFNCSRQGDVLRNFDILFPSIVKVFVVSGFFIGFGHFGANMIFYGGFWRTPCGRSIK